MRETDTRSNLNQFVSGLIEASKVVQFSEWAHYIVDNARDCETDLLIM